MLDNKYDFKKIEEKVAKLWDQNSELIKATTQFNPKKPIFSFLEGPPTANAPPGIHHIEVRVFKDVMCRFKYMQGFTVPRKGGWDCHGLPVEVQVEKKLNLKSKKEVVKYGIDKFNSECRKDVFTFIKHWEETTKKIGYWIDLDSPYRTLDNNYIESVWWSLKEIHNKGLLYEGHKVVPYCPRCETPLSSHEVALGYKDVTDNAITVKLQVKGKPNRFFLAWTTTPWTLPSNVCLAVNPKITYAIVKYNGEEFILAKELLKKFFDDPKIVEEISGEKLVGLQYEPLFNYFKDKLYTPVWKVVPEDYVNVEEGTGIVHQAPAFGEADYESCKKHNLPFVQPVNPDGTFTAEVADFKGLFVKDADKHIINNLEARNLLFKTERYLHSYPFCWRCSTPLLYFAMVSWFIAVSKIKDKLVENNKKIVWFPDHIKEGRFGNWLEGAKDWALSRTKFWGTPFPVWKCECKHIEVIGSIEELSKKGSHVPKDMDLHKPQIDKITLKCPNCKKEMHRVPDVIDCWYDSGSATFAQFHYPFENKELFEKSHPYDFIAEAIDQTRGWFYTLLVLSTILFDSLAYKRCAVGGLLCDDKGEKMSKSKGNIVVPNEMFDKVGVDVVRILMCSYPLGENIRFGMIPINEVILPFLRILWNCFYFANEFSENQGIKNGSDNDLQIEDKWLISKINSVVKKVSSSLDEGRYDKAIEEIESFVNEDLSRWYIKLVRDRSSEKDEALAFTFNYVFERLIKVFAPFAPYLSEEMYQITCKKEKSVHFDSWPVTERIDENLEKNMSCVKEIISAINNARDKANISLRWPIGMVEIVSSDENIIKSVKELDELIKLQSNVKTIGLHASTPPFVKERLKGNIAQLGKSFGVEAPKLIAKLASETPRSVIDHLSKEGKFTMRIGKQAYELMKDHVIVERDYPKNFIEAEFKGGQIYLNTDRTPELDAEGFARELMRRVQALRKDAGLKKTDVVSAHITCNSNTAKVLASWTAKIKQKVNATSLTISSEKPSAEFKHVKEDKIKQEVFVIGINSH